MHQTRSFTLIQNSDQPKLKKLENQIAELQKNINELYRELKTKDTKIIENINSLNKLKEEKLILNNKILEYDKIFEEKENELKSKVIYHELQEIIIQELQSVLKKNNDEFEAMSKEHSSIKIGNDMLGK